MGYFDKDGSRRRILSSSLYGLNDVDDPTGTARLTSQKHELARLDWQASQALARGLISPEDYTAARGQDRSNLVQRMLALNGPGTSNSGSTLETIGDVLSLPNYAVGSLTEATLESETSNLFSLEGARDAAATVALGPLATTVLGGNTSFEVPLGTWGDWGPQGLRLGFGLDAYAKAWTNKTEFIKVAQDNAVFDSESGNFWGGLAADIFLDPTTYLSFGVASGARVAIKAETKAAAKLAGHAGAEAADLTLSRFGTELYRRAAHKLTPSLRKEMIERGEDGRHLLDGPIAKEWHDRIADYAVRNFDDLKREMLDQARSGWWNNAKAVVAPAAAANRARFALLAEAKGAKLAGMGVEDMFQETASIFGKERGLYKTQTAQRVLAGKESLKLFGTEVGTLPSVVGRVSEKFFDVFDKGWDAPPEVLERFRLTQVAVDTAYQGKLEEYTKVFSHLNPEMRGVVTDAIEARAQHLAHGEATLGAMARYAPEVEEAITFFQREMDDILKAEQEAGFATQKAEGYVSHIANPAVREYYEQVLRKNAEEYHRVENKFTQQRLIANIAQGEDIFGKGALKKDAYEILALRKRASLAMQEEHKLYKFIADNYSLPQAIVHAASRGMSKGLLRGWARRAGYGVAEVLHTNQVYEAAHGNLSRLGFKEGNLAHNREVLDYLARPNDAQVRVGQGARSGKYSPDGEAQATRLGLTEAARLHYVEKGTALVREAVPLPSEFNYAPLGHQAFDSRHGLVQGGRIRGLSRMEGAGKFEVQTAMKMLDDPNHPGWDALLRDTVAGGEARMSRVYGFLAGLNNYTVRFLDSQLPGMIPDIEERVMRALVHQLENTGKKPVAKTARGAAGAEKRWVAKQEEVREGLIKVLSRFADPLEVRKVRPVIPPTLIEMAKATRRASGIVVDDVPPTRLLLDEVQELHAKLGFTPEMAKQLNRTLFDADDVTKAAHADLVIQTLKPFAAQEGKRGTLAFIPSRFADDKVVPFTLTLPRKIKGNVIPERFDQDLAIPAAEASLGRGSVAGEAAAAKRAVQLQQGVVPAEELKVFDRGGAPSTTVSGSGTSPLRAGVSAGVRQADHAFAARKVVIESLQRRVQEASAKLDGLLPESVDKMKARISQAKKAYSEALAEWKGAAKGSAEKRAAKAKLDGARSAREAAKKVLTDNKANIEKYQSLYPELKAARDELKTKILELRKAQAGRDETILATQKDTARGGGILDEGVKLQRELTPADRLAQARRQAANPKLDQASVAASADEARDAQAALARGEAPPPSQSGLARPSTKPAELKLYLPESVVKLINDATATDIPAEFSTTAKKMLRMYDTIIGVFKADMLRPHGGYYARNAMTSAALTYLRQGLGFLNPKNQFYNMRAGMAAVSYALGKWSDLPRELGPVKIGKVVDWLTEMGNFEVKAVNGRAIKMSELLDEARMRGITKGVASADMFDNLSPWMRGAAVASGIGAGAAGGALAGSLGGQEGMSYGSLFGAVAGGLLGGRALGKAGPGLGGLPVRTMNGVTGLLQSQWRPVMRVGEAVSEMPFRLNFFVQEFIKSGSVQEAATQVYRHMNDYSSLSAFERRWLRRMVPFYAWTKHAMKVTGVEMIEEPGKLNSIYKTFRDWNATHDADPEDVPDYLHDKLAMVFEFSGQDAGGKDATERKALVLQATPLEDVAAVLSGLLPGGGSLAEETKEFVQNIVTRGSFVGVAGMEMAFQYDTFTGKSLEKASKPEDWEQAPDWLKFVVGYQPAKTETKDGKKVTVAEAQVSSTMAWLLGEIPASRFIRFTRQLYEADEQDRARFNTWTLARQFLGVTAYKVDPNTQQYFLNKGKIDKMKNLLDHVVKDELGPYQGQRQSSVGARRRRSSGYFPR